MALSLRPKHQVERKFALFNEAVYSHGGHLMKKAVF